MRADESKNGAEAPELAATAGEIGILERRKIEAELVQSIYPVLAAELGEARARALLAQAIRAAAIASGRSFAGKTPGGPSLQAFQELFELWTRGDALRLEVLRADERHFDFNVRRCRYAETYHAMGLGEIGAILSCNRDGAFCEGYDPRIKLTRTQTIMEGASHCDFRFTISDDTPADR
ncbi:L-2-amino-thiazoline-4-carboxylic acid hydrolase [Acidisoma sp. C75]